MARLSPTLAAHFIFFVFVFIFVASALADDESFVRATDTKLLGLINKKEKLSHLKLYWHDIVGGKNPTAVPVVQPSTNSSTFFGLISVIDDPLTTGPEMSSKMVGRAQGFYSSASQQELGLLMAMNFAFMQGKYNGSTITIMGRNCHDLGELGTRGRKQRFDEIGIRRHRFI